MEAINFCKDPENHEIFSGYVNGLLEDAVQRSGQNENDERVRRYKQLRDKLSKRVGCSERDARTFEDQLPSEIKKLRSTPLILAERSDLRISPHIIELVNNALNSMLAPEVEQGMVPLLDEECIIVCCKGSLQRQIRQQATQETHPLRLLLGERIRQRFPRALRESRYDQIFTSHDLPGKPIFYPEGEINAWQGKEAHEMREDARRAGEEITTGFILLHENLHRASKGVIKAEWAKPISPDDPLFAMAFFPDRWATAMQSVPDIKSALEDMNKRLEDYARNHNPAVVIEGARVILFASEENGKSTMIASSGYDLNETIVELLALQLASASFIPHLRRNYSPDVASYFEKRIFDIAGKQVSNSRKQNLMEDVLPYLAELGLSTPISIFQAYANGEIPLLHAKKFPGRDYFI